MEYFGFRAFLTGGYSSARSSLELWALGGCDGSLSIGWRLGSSTFARQRVSSQLCSFLAKDAQIFPRFRYTPTSFSLPSGSSTYTQSNTLLTKSMPCADNSL